MRKITVNAMLLSILLLCYPIEAQEADFSGKWRLNHEKTQLSDMPDIIIEIIQKEGIIDYTKTVKLPKRDYVTHMVLSLDGEEGTYKNWQNKELKCSCVMENGILKLFYESYQMRSSKWVILKMRDEHSLSPDRKTLSVDHAEWWDNRGGKWPHPLVYDKLAENAEGFQNKKK